ncbi:hypothetical protein [Paenibacillus lautus]|uniref:hypothetical protein n=1 Tax=Paenibacillus lautus TaxID=1401 RepID=UPI001C7DDEB5|nr:hypothetical protein [Paenibacillus lautus]MBX4152400.1 hypothetical protein [Paenibacillus lautus]
MEQITGTVVYIDENDEWEFDFDNSGAYMQKMFLEEVDQMLQLNNMQPLNDGDRITLVIERRQG